MTPRRHCRRPRVRDRRAADLRHVQQKQAEPIPSPHVSPKSRADRGHLVVADAPHAAPPGWERLLARLAGFLPNADGQESIKDGLIEAGFRGPNAVTTFLGAKVLFAAGLPLLFFVVMARFGTDGQHLSGRSCSRWPASTCRRCGCGRSRTSARSR